MGKSDLPRIGLAEQAYTHLKNDIFDFRLLPGDRFTEQEVAERLKVSRTPVREALYRLEREGYVQVHFRSGWSVLPFDFDRFEQLYDLRIVLEQAAIHRICHAEQAADLEQLKATWLVPPAERVSDSVRIAELDEAFHQGLLFAAGNHEMTRVHRDITEKIRIIRRLDFTKAPRIAATYDEHAKILRLLIERKATQASLLISSHIEASKAEVRKITLHMLHSARQKLAT